jgi:predicted metalloprotease
MRIEGHRRSTNFEDRGRGRGGGGGLPVRALVSVARFLGVKGTLIVAGVLGAGYFFLPTGIKQQVLGALTGQSQGAGDGAQGAGSVCQASPGNGKACDFSRVVLASTEDVWKAAFQKGALPRYERQAGAYQEPTLVVFSNAVSTGGCGNATSAVGPFYCPRDKNLYIDPGFYDVMEKRLKAPGDFAQAYVIAHEVGHHIQNQQGISAAALRGLTRSEREGASGASVRLELQADCLAGVWAHSTQSRDLLEAGDVEEALTAAAAIGDDRLQQQQKGRVAPESFTHGTAAQRSRWFRTGFERGELEACDTFKASTL